MILTLHIYFDKCTLKLVFWYFILHAAQFPKHTKRQILECNYQNFPNLISPVGFPKFNLQLICSRYLVNIVLLSVRAKHLD